VAQSSTLAHEHGEWDAALRLAANCSFCLGDWPSALRYAPEGVKISRDELGSGFVRSMYQEADGYLYLGDPVRAWDLYTAAAKASPGHPLPRYYRGESLLLLTKLLDLYQRDSVEYGKPSNLSKEVLDELVRSHGRSDGDCRPAGPLGPDLRVLLIPEFLPGRHADGTGVGVSLEPRSRAHGHPSAVRQEAVSQGRPLPPGIHLRQVLGSGPATEVWRVANRRRLGAAARAPSPGIWRKIGLRRDSRSRR